MIIDSSMVRNFSKIGNVSRSYVHQPHVVTPRGLVVGENLVLKMYEMTPLGRPEDPDLVREAMNFLRGEIDHARLSPLSGMGFVILSEMLNVARWDVRYPNVPVNCIYEIIAPEKGVDGERFDSQRTLNINEVGAFCTWEMKIVDREGDAWTNFLRSDRSSTNKLKYLEKMIEGEL